MRQITINVDDNVRAISVTTFSDFETYHNINAMAFDIKDTDEITMPKHEPIEDDFSAIAN